MLLCCCVNSKTTKRTNDTILAPRGKRRLVPEDLISYSRLPSRYVPHSSSLVALEYLVLWLLRFLVVLISISCGPCRTLQISSSHSVSPVLGSNVTTTVSSQSLKVLLPSESALRVRDLFSRRNEPELLLLLTWSGAGLGGHSKSCSSSIVASLSWPPSSPMLSFASTSRCRLQPPLLRSLSQR